MLQLSYDTERNIYFMSYLNYNTKSKFKHLNFKHYLFIQSEYNHFISSKSKNKTAFMNNLASSIGTSLSNLYNIVNDGMISILNHDLTYRSEFSAKVAFDTRHPQRSSNSKLSKCLPFINLVCETFFDNNNLSSIDEIVHSLIIDFPNIDSVCTKTIYNYINNGSIDIKKYHTPYILRRKPKTIKREPKRQKGVSIDFRDKIVETREEFGHWEGDLIVGGNYVGAGAIFTLVERKTRKVISFKLNDKTSKQVYMAINKLEREYKDLFPKIFKTITFDNGSEFSRYKDFEKSILFPKKKRTKVYFAHPYS